MRASVNYPKLARVYASVRYEKGTYSVRGGYVQIPQQSIRSLVVSVLGMKNGDLLNIGKHYAEKTAYPLQT